nr:hypothetical protein [Tanacetum cinerariifolium]
AALLEDTQLKKVLEKSRQETHKPSTSGSSEGADFKSKVLANSSDSDNESWGNSEDESDNVNDDDNHDDNANDDDSGNENDDGNDAHDTKRTDSDDDNENLSFTLKDYDKEEHDKEYESDDDSENVYEEEEDDLYKDVNVRSLGAKHEKERKGDEEMTDADQNVSQEKSYEQVIEDAHVTLTSSQKTKSSKQSSSISSNFASKFLILDNVPPVVDEVASMIHVKNCQEESSTQVPSLFTVPETAILNISTAHTTTIPPTISMIPLLQLTTPPPAPITVSTATSISALLDFSSLFGFDQRVSTFERELSQLKKESSRREEAIHNVVEKSVKDIIKDEVKSQLPQILPKEVSDFATLVIQSTINESLEKVILVKFSSQPKSTYEAAALVTVLELKNILLDKIEKIKSYQAAPEHREFYDGLVKSYNLDKDLFLSYGNVYSLKRDCEGDDKDEDPPAGSNQGLKKRIMRKDDEPSKGSKSKESKSSTSSKGTKSHPKSSGKSVQAEEPVFEDADIKPNKPLTPDRAWNDGKSIDFRPPHKWISNIAKARQPPRTFDELMSTPINFSAYLINYLKIDNLTQEILIGPAFNLLKGSCKSFVELKFHFEDKPLPLIEVQGRQVVHSNYFFNNDLKYLKGRSSSRKYTTSITKTKGAKYDNIKGIKDMIPALWSPVKVAYEKYAMWGLTASLGPKETLQPRERCQLRPECGIGDVHQTRCRGGVGMVVLEGLVAEECRREGFNGMARKGVE